jgi:carbamoyl-phosphate synthase/aspartate carbamoyltransferase
MSTNSHQLGSSFYPPTNGHADGDSPPRLVAPASSVSAASDAVLELGDGSAYSGISFGAPGKSVAGECVFQTGKFKP